MRFAKRFNLNVPQKLEAEILRPAECAGLRMTGGFVTSMPTYDLGA